MAKIVIDARESGTTTGRYVDQLVIYLAKLQPQHRFTILAKPHRLDFFKQNVPQLEVVECHHKEFSFDEQLGFKKQLTDLKPDLVHFPMVQQPVLYKGRSVTTMNDLTTVRFKNPAKNPLIFTVKQTIYKWVNKRVAKKADELITYTKYVKDDVVQFTGISPDKITVIPLSADRIPDAAEPVETLIGKQFIMYIGRPTPHKNLERLLEAFVELQKQQPELQLVLAGKKDVNYQRIEDGVKQKGIKNVYFTDFVSEGQLRWLYENCRAYVFPSLSEGFGLPGLEAMIHGAPVVSSNATCLPEVYGEAAHYFDPLDVQAMARAIDEVLTNESLRQTLINRGYEQVKQYSWQNTAEQTLKVYEQALIK